MPWARLEANYHENKKILRAGGDAELVYVRGISYAQFHQTDGFIDETTARRLASDRPDPAAAIERLVIHGLWEETEGGWQIHDYFDYQQSKADIERKAEQNRARVTKSRESKRNALQSESNALRNAAVMHYPGVNVLSTVTPVNKGVEVNTHTQSVTHYNGDVTHYTDARVTALADAYAHATSRKLPQLSQKQRSEAFEVFASLVDDVDPEDVAGYVAYLKTDPWWREPKRTISPQNVADHVVGWIEGGRPEAQVPQRGGKDPGLSADEIRAYGQNGERRQRT